MSLRPRPVGFKWDAERAVMVPDPHYLAICRRQFQDGAGYVLEEVSARSMKAHKFFFVWLHQAWLNLPEDVTDRFPTEDHLRSWALVMTGWYSEENHPCETDKHARQVATIIRRHEPFAVIERRGATVRVRYARSMRIAAPPFGMTGDEFKKASKDVMDLVQTLNPNLPAASLAAQANIHVPRSSR